MSKDWTFDANSMDLSDIFTAEEQPAEQFPNVGKQEAPQPSMTQPQWEQPQTQPTQWQPPVQQAPVVQQQASNVPAINLDDFANDLMNLPSVQIVASDTELIQFAIPKYECKEGNVDRVSSLTTQKFEIKYHFDDTIKRSFACFGGQCCRDHGSPTVRFVRPVVSYVTDRKGNIIDGSVSIKAMRFGKDTDSQFQMIEQQMASLGKSVADCDVLVSTTNEQYQQLKLMPVGQATWKTHQDMTRQVMENWATNKSRVFDALFNVLSETEYVTARAQAMVNAPLNQQQAGQMLR